jgi:hypothetical protein
MFAYQLEHIFSYHISVTPPEMVGPVPDGMRLNFYITGGEITGPKVVGKVRPSGADWVKVRRDGIGLIDVRAVFETNDGALIYVTVDGTTDLGENGYEQIVAGMPPLGATLFRTFPRFHTAHPQYLWLNRLHCLGIGEAHFDHFRVGYDVYAVR